ncbi:MAG TPA: helical backbone metal receptor [Candidatus Cybelea sp.]|nr:helical backbone metal receptor [Candidatus Cybelea sp.]
MSRSLRLVSLLLAVFAGTISWLARPARALTPPRGQASLPPMRAGSRMVTDEVGRRVVIPGDVRRIVSLAPNLTETVYALGLGDRLVGDTSYCDTPPEAKTKPHVGGPTNASVEAIVALRPDLVFATMINREETVDALAHLGIPVYTTDPHTVRGMIRSVDRMAEVLGAEKQGAALTAKLNTTLEELQARLATVRPTRVLFVVWLDPLITVGENTFIADALRCAGAESVISSRQNWPQIGLEEVVRLQPDYIVLAASHTGEGSRTIQSLHSRAVWRDLEAVESGRVAIISDEINRPSPALIDVIEQLARDLHPQAFAGRDGPVRSADDPGPEAVAAARKPRSDACPR